MKRILYLLLFVLTAFGVGCDDNDTKIPAVFPEKTGTVRDSEGNEYRWVRYAGLDWLASNFRAGEPYYNAPAIEIGYDEEELSFDNKTQAKEDYNLYGNLYTWAEAVENASLLDAGEGEWRLPTDADFQRLERALGMSAGECLTKGWRGDPVGELLMQDSTGTNLNFRLGGLVNGTMRGTAIEWRYERVREFGYYWCADVLESDYKQEGKIVAYRAIRSANLEIEREWCTEGVYRSGYEVIYPRMMSVRYVRDAKK